MTTNKTDTTKIESTVEKTETGRVLPDMTAPENNKPETDEDDDGSNTPDWQTRFEAALKVADTAGRGQAKAQALMLLALLEYSAVTLEVETAADMAKLKAGAILKEFPCKNVHEQKSRQNAVNNMRVVAAYLLHKGVDVMDEDDDSVSIDERSGHLMIAAPLLFGGEDKVPDNVPDMCKLNGVKPYSMAQLQRVAAAVLKEDKVVASKAPSHQTTDGVNLKVALKVVEKLATDGAADAGMVKQYRSELLSIAAYLSHIFEADAIAEADAKLAKGEKAA